MNLFHEKTSNPGLTFQMHKTFSLIRGFKFYKFCFFGFDFSNYNGRTTEKYEFGRGDGYVRANYSRWANASDDCGEGDFNVMVSKNNFCKQEFYFEMD